MDKQSWQEYGAPGTTVLTSDDVELAQARLEGMWQDAMRHAREAPFERGQCDMRTPGDAYIHTLAATVTACGWLRAPCAR